jgi:hypothetical protein
MTSQINYLKEPFIYAQSLDNSGNTECWVISLDLVAKKVTPSESDVKSILNTIDSVRSEGRVWSIGNQNVRFYVLLDGACVVRIKPVDLDASGRFSYIQIVANNYSEIRVMAADALSNIADITSRRTDGSEVTIANRFKNILRLPRWFIFIHMCLFSRRVLND